MLGTVAMWNIFCLLLPLFCSSHPTGVRNSIKFSNCGPNSLQAVWVTPCPSEPCQEKHNTNVTVSFQFTAVEDATSLKNNVYGIIAGIPVPFPLPNSDGCTNSNITCPVQKGNTYTYSGVFPVLKTYPDIKVLVKWEMIDEKNTQLLCFIFPLEIND